MKWTAMNAAPLALWMIGIVAAPQVALCCGFCANDKAASVYSFESIQWAQRNGAQYLVAVVVGPRTPGEFERAIAVLKNSPGIAVPTVKSAFAQHAVSFVLRGNADPASVEHRFVERKDGFRIQILHGNWAAQ